jgi:ABC-2 type transport system ATP-binding protein
VDLEVRSGEILGLLGPNGAGKTTLLRRLAGVVPSQAGTVALDGLDPNTSRTVRARIGYLPEEPPLYAEETARRYVEYMAALSGVPRSRRRPAALSALDRAGAAKLAGRPTGRLSKGQRQRVGLAAAIVHRPAVLLLDEPTSGLDPRQVADFRRTLRELALSCGVILSTHLLAEAQAVCDRVVILDEGAVVADTLTRPSGTPGGLEEAFFRALGGNPT